jgi:hypothetical protein
VEYLANKMFIRKIKSKRAIAALPTLLVIGGAIVDIGIIVAAGIYFLTSADFGVRLSAEALAAAKSGIQDGVMRLSRDKNLLIPSYSLVVGGRSSVEVTICADTPQCGGSGHHLVSAVGKSFTKRRKMEAILKVNANTGGIVLESLKEAPL